jgi:hypothetical protein
MKVIVLVIMSWFIQLVVVGENTYNGGRGIGNTNKGEKILYLKQQMVILYAIIQ